MRSHRRLCLVLVLALTVAACADDGAETTTTGSAETPPPPTWIRECQSDNPGTSSTSSTASAFDLCANILEGGSPSVEEGETADLPQGFEHFCRYVEDQALIVDQGAVPEVFAPLGFVPAGPNDLILSEEPSEEDQVGADRVIAAWRAGGLGAYKLVPPEGGDPPLDLFEQIEAVKGAGFEQASPHYLLQPAGTWKYGPHSAVATLDPDFEWGQLEMTGPELVPGGRLVVIDTGANGDLSFMGITKVEPEPDPATAAFPLEPSVVGHGTFAASIAKQYNPGLGVEVYRANWENGTFNEASLTDAFLRSQLPEDDPPPLGTVSLSAGTYPCAPRYEPLGIQLAISGQQVIAASGNDGYTHVPQQLYPASHSDVIGVSAYDVSWTPATWANTGEVYAPGEDVVGWYSDGPQSQGSLAVWSGTSFATPHFAACLTSGDCSAPPPPP